MNDSKPSTIYLKDYQPPLYKVTNTRLAIDLYDDKAIVTATLNIKFNHNKWAVNRLDKLDFAGQRISNKEVEVTSKALYLDGRDLELLSLKLNGETVEPQLYTVDNEGLTIKEVPGTTFVVEIMTQIYPQKNTSLEGLYRSNQLFCTQCEAQGFRKITYYIDRPDIMSVYTTRISADKTKYPVLLSNGNLVETGDCGNNRHYATWHDPFKKPSYLFAMVAGNLKHKSDEFITKSGRRIDLKIYVEEENLDKCDYALISLKRAMQWDEKTYNCEYDLDIFMIVAVNDFNMGAMENKGLNIFNSSCVLANPLITTDSAYQRVESVVAHEYFHNWSGNRVTLRDWFQLSLKEGFTVYRDAEFSADMGAATVKRIQDVSLLRTVQFPEDAGPTAHPVRPDSFIEISNFYTPTVYEKGAEIVGMLHTLMGEKNFKLACNNYFRKFDGEAVTVDDFLEVMEGSTPMDLNQFKRWYSQSGTPTVKVFEQWDSHTKQYTLTVQQKNLATNAQPEKVPLHIPIRIGLLSQQGRALSFTTAQELKPVQEIVVHLKESIGQFNFTLSANDEVKKPIPSLLRNFSAPVKLEFDYTEADLSILIRYDQDGFNRWEAAQRLACNNVLSISEHIKSIKNWNKIVAETSVSDAMLEAFAYLLKNALNHEDQALYALMLTLPRIGYLIELQEQVNINALCRAKQRAAVQLAEAFDDLWLSIYDQTSGNDKAGQFPNAQSIGIRSLKNTALYYLSVALNKKKLQLIFDQYYQSTNMTDRFAALQALVCAESPLTQEPKIQCLEHFYDTYKHEPLALDQWFLLQATNPLPKGLARVEALVEHPDFDLKNPNKVRAVIGAFSVHNYMNFHQEDGGGYRFLADHIIKLDAVNPQIAARLLGPLTRWKKFDKKRQQLMKEQLVRILSQKSLSKDVYEITNKSQSLES